ncbi:MAG: T9SS type A sorting domain-containing protein [Saprospiraceae bacterium]|nr:T9SS type A sorting domain-containing protein [Saprospiraceae bacterium]
MTNLGPLHRREYRTATNGYAFPQQFSSNSRYWLRIVRQGNNFTMYSSPNGQAWYLIASQPIQMSGCIQMGLLVTNDQQTGSAWATFDNVSVTGSVGSLVTAPDMLVASPPQGVEETSFSVFPNPTSGELNVNLSEYEGKKISLEVLNLQGQVIHSQEIDEVQTWVMPLNLDVSYRGMYLLRVRSEGIADAVQRFVIQR